MRFATLCVFTVACAVGLSAPPAWAFRDARSSLADAAHIPLERAIEQAKLFVPGQAVDAELVRNNERVVYEIDILDQGRRSHTVFVDAQTGQVLTFGDGRRAMHGDGTMSGTAPRDSQPGMTGTNDENPSGTNSGSTEDGGSGDRNHADQNQGGRS